MSSKFMIMVRRLLKIKIKNQSDFDALYRQIHDAERRSEQARDEFEQALKRAASDNGDAAHEQK